MKSTFQVKGMTCSSCEQLVSESLTDEGATNVVADHIKGTVIVEHEDTLPVTKIKSIIKEEGYEVVE